MNYRSIPAHEVFARLPEEVRIAGEARARQLVKRLARRHKNDLANENGASEWPPLPASGFLVGRAASAADVDLGDAIFSQATSDGLEAKPCPVVLPQYALWQDRDGSMIRVFVVQAEKHVSDPAGEPIYGLRTFDGDDIITPGEELRLLGTAKPAP